MQNTIKKVLIHEKLCKKTIKPAYIFKKKKKKWGWIGGVISLHMKRGHKT
jgi:hypothetical protein